MVFENPACVKEMTNMRYASVLPKITECFIFISPFLFLFIFPFVFVLQKFSYPGSGFTVPGDYLKNFRNKISCQSFKMFDGLVFVLFLDVLASLKNMAKIILSK